MLRMARPISVLELTTEEREELGKRVRSSTTSKRDHLRASIVLRRSGGVKQAVVAKQLGVSVACVNKWSHRFELQALNYLDGKIISRTEDKHSNVEWLRFRRTA